MRNKVAASLLQKEAANGANGAMEREQELQCGFFKMLGWFEFRCCLICGAWPVRVADLCVVCEPRVKRWFEHEEREPAPFRDLKIGFEWSPQDGEGKGQLLHGLKGAYSARGWQAMAWRFMQKYPELGQKRRWILIPIPNHEWLKKDHAWHFARALAPWVGGHVVEALARPVRGSQRGLKRRERQNLELALKSSKTRAILRRWRLKGGGVALVDDVLTTGATMLAAQAALGPAFKPAIWTLAFRTTLRKPSRIGYNASRLKGSQSAGPESWS